MALSGVNSYSMALAPGGTGQSARWVAEIEKAHDILDLLKKSGSSTDVHNCR